MKLPYVILLLFLCLSPLQLIAQNVSTTEGDSCIETNQEIKQANNDSKKYFLISGNINQPKNAKIILIANSHNIQMDKVATAYVLEKIGSQDDIFLMEGVQYTQEPNYQPKHWAFEFLSDTFQIDGWDDLNRAHDMIDNISSQKRILGQIEESRSKTPDKSRVELLIKLKRLHDQYQERSSGRNSSLISAISFYLNKSKGKIFVSSGKNHLQDKKVMAFLDSLRLPYVLLIPNSSFPARETEKSAEEYIDSLNGND